MSGVADNVEATQRRVLVLGVEPNSLLNFRKGLFVALRKAGHEVHAASAAADPDTLRGLALLGVTHHQVYFARTGMNPMKDSRTILSLTKLFRALRPDCILAYTPKPVMYGAIAAKLAGCPHFAALITGLGYSFNPGQELRRKFANHITRTLYRMALPLCKSVIFQNPDDLQHFKSLRLYPATRPDLVVNGSGVDLAHFSVVPLPTRTVFLLIGRLLVDKGVREYAEATMIAKAAYPDISVRLLGPFDPSPNSVTKKELQQWQDSGLEYLGSTGDVRPYIAAASVIVLPSYREGTPRSVLEGMAMGRAIITTDAPGCRETVVHGVNGLLVPLQDSAALANAMMELASDPDKIVAMGRESRRIAEIKYESGAVALDTLQKAGILPIAV